MILMNGKRKQAQVAEVSDLKQKGRILNDLPTPVMTIDLDYNVTYMNASGAEVLNLTPDEVIGRKCYDLFKTEHCQTPECRCTMAMENDGVFTGETSARPGNSEVPIRYTGAPVKDEEGNIIGAMEYILDITETKNILDESNLKADYLNNIPTPVMVVDKDFTVQFMNPAGANAVQLSQEECAGRKCYDLFKTHDCNTAQCQVGKAMREKRKSTGDTEANLPSGKLPIRYTGAPLFDEDGEVIGGLEYVLDITDETAFMKQLEELSGAAVDGKLNHRADAEQFSGSYRKIVDGTNQLLDAVLAPIQEAQQVLNKMADGDLTTRMHGDYKGDNAKLKETLNTTVESIGHTLRQVSNAADQVNSGSSQVASASQSLSQGATEQAASLEEISSSMTQVGSQTKLNAENAQQANSLANTAREAATEGNSQMQNMLSAMSEINDQSNQVQKIIKVIE